MIKRPTKSEIRASLTNEIDEFLKKGGEIVTFDQGDSSLIDGKYDRNQFVYGLPKQERTPLPDTVRDINLRKTNKKTNASPKKTKRVKKVIYDDFGEPLREVWVEE